MFTILVASDFSRTAERAVEEALELGRALDARIEIIHVHPVGSMPMPPTLDIVTRVPAADEVARAEEALTAQAKMVNAAGLPCTTYSAFGAPAEEIVRRAAEIGARLIVVGRHGHRPIAEVIMGGTSTRLMRLAKCPVVVVPSPLEAQPW